MRFFETLRIIRWAIGICCLSQAFAVGAETDLDTATGRLSVMTQNLYVGADLFKILEAAAPEDVPLKAAEIFSDIQATDFRQRAAVIAELIAQNRPHLIGLQEVSLVRTQCPDDIVFPPHNPGPNATDEFADYLQILLGALSDRGLDYHVAATVDNADIEVPVANFGLLDCDAPLFDARLTDRDVTLRRSDVEVSVPLTGNYQANLPVPTAAGTVVFTRGYNIVDASVHGRKYRFVNTHLEVSGNPVANFFQYAQATELVKTLNALPAFYGDELIVVAGDFNSAPVDGPTALCVLPPAFDKVGDCPTPYALLSDAGLIDTWTLRNARFDEGYTCCQGDLLTNADSQLDERIDHVWVRPPVLTGEYLNFIRAVHTDVLGDQAKELSIDGLWPSDHGGVVADMTLRQ